MFSDKLLHHFQHPRHAGELPEPAVTIEVNNPACGDVMRLSALVVDGRIVEARYQVRGCTASIAAGSALAEMLQGASLDEAGRLRAVDVEVALDALPEASRHAAVLCTDAVKALLRKVLASR